MRITIKFGDDINADLELDAESIIIQTIEPVKITGDTYSITISE